MSIKKSLIQQIKSTLSSEANTIKVLASSGSGKTTLLTDFSNYKSKSKILYLVFSEAMAKEALKKMPNNVLVKTFHGLAYDVYGSMYKDKLTTNLFINLKPVMEMCFLKNDNQSYKFLIHVFKAFEIYMASHYIEHRVVFDLIPDEIKSIFKKEKALLIIDKIWIAMNDIDNKKILITHDFYLKKFELNISKLQYNFDYVLIDEAQDINYCMNSIPQKMKNIFNSKLFYVGDKYQYIFSFQNTKNIIETMNADIELKSLNSYRFGKNIADQANNLILLNNDKNNLIHGNDSIIDSLQKEDFDFNKQYAVISRYNVTLFNYALKLENKKIYFTDQNKIKNLSLLMDVYNLYSNKKQKIKNKYIKSFMSFSDLIKTSSSEGNKEIEMACLFVKNNKNDFNLEKQIFNLKSNIVQNINEADVVFSTAHKSKGLEFEQVILANDYIDFFDKNGEIKNNFPINELYALYVALTRAKKRLITNKLLKKVENYLIKKKLK